MKKLLIIAALLVLGGCSDRESSGYYISQGTSFGNVYNRVMLDVPGGLDRCQLVTNNLGEARAECDRLNGEVE